MNLQKIFFLLIIVSIGTIFIATQFQNQENFVVLVNNSGPYIGTSVPYSYGYDGSGIIISVIDTGVDFNHPDLFGFGTDGKIIGGYDFVDNDQTPEDTDGHGTQVDLIIKAIEKSIEDGANIINISLGINQTNTKIDQAVTKAIQNNIFVVTAAGNFGPELNTIGSPGMNPNAITVGATFNNIQSSLVSIFEIEDKTFNVFPMVGTQSLEEPITSQIIFGKYGKIQDLLDLDIKDSILLVERGSGVENEIFYFSDKEKNAYTLGAKAIVVYNNEPGIFFGELIHENIEEGYSPTIPTLSLSREDGIIIKEMLLSDVKGTLDIFYHPDFVSYFSSRGPVSPFYIKPDVVAPGAFINTTDINKNYNISSGTSFAAPHVAGTAALILQKNPQLTPEELKSILMTTSDKVSDQYNKKFPIEVAGTGRINASKAINAEIIITPPNLIFNLSADNQIQTKYLKIKGINYDTMSVRFEDKQVADFDYNLDNQNLVINAKLIQQSLGEFENRMVITHNKIDYDIPIIVRVSKATIMVNDDNGKLSFDVSSPTSWSYAKISITNKETGKKFTESIAPNKNSELTVYEPGEYC